jgi:hypothetical protein
VGVKPTGREGEHSSPSSAEKKECVDLYLHSTNVLWRGAYLSTGTTLPLFYAMKMLISLLSGIVNFLDLCVIIFPLPNSTITRLYTHVVEIVNVELFMKLKLLILPCMNECAEVKLSNNTVK